MLATRPTPSWTTTLVRLSATAYSIYSRVATTWWPFLRSQPEDASCGGDKDPLITDCVSISLIPTLISFMSFNISSFALWLHEVPTTDLKKSPSLFHFFFSCVINLEFLHPCTVTGTALMSHNVKVFLII